MLRAKDPPAGVACCIGCGADVYELRFAFIPTDRALFDAAPIRGELHRGDLRRQAFAESWAVADLEEGSFQLALPRHESSPAPAPYYRPHRCVDLHRRSPGHHSLTTALPPP